MAVPKQRKTPSKRNMRRSHHALKKSTLVKCKKCGEMILPHTYCPFCGYYAGRMVVDVAAKLSKKEKKKHEKEMAKKEKEAKKEDKEERKGPSRPLSVEELSRKT